MDKIPDEEIKNKEYLGYVNSIKDEFKKINEIPYFKLSCDYNGVSRTLNNSEASIGSLVCEIINILNETQFACVARGHIRCANFY